MTDFDLGGSLARSIVECSRVATALARSDGAIVYGNAAFATLLGYDGAEMTGLTVESVIEGTPAVTDGPEQARDCRIRRKNLTTTWVHVIATPLPASSEANAPAFVLQFIDIERQKQLEDKFLLNESRMNFAMEAAGQGVWDHDVVANTMYYSLGWRRMRGIPDDEAIDGSREVWLQRVHPEDRERLRHMIRHQDKGSNEFRVLEYRERHRNGHYIWIQSRGRPAAYDPDGYSTRTIGTDTDITDRKLANEAFELVSERLSLALDASKIGVWEEDIASGKAVWDERMFEIYGLSYVPVELHGSVWHGAVHPEDREAAKAGFAAAVAAVVPYEAQFRIVQPTGAVRHIRSRANPFVDANGAVKFIGAEWDVTADMQQAHELNTAKALAETRYEQVQQAQARIQHAALHDYLTNLPNRRYLDQTLAGHGALSDGPAHDMALLHIDLDGFKSVNDTYGHAAGDFLLQHTANVLRGNVREGDFIARIGGDEFVIVSPFHGDDSDLRAMADRIVSQLHEPVPYRDIVMQIGASIGIACGRSVNGEIDYLLQEADSALYQAKNLGRNRYQFASH